jgi:hypothetical protein
MNAGFSFHATCRINEPMNQTAQDSKEKRGRFKQLAEAQNWQSVCRRGAKKQYSPLGLQAHSLAQAQSTFSTCCRRRPTKTLFSHHFRVFA